MGDDFLWIRDTAALEGLIPAIASGPLAVDSEADSFHHYREKICLVQLSFDGTDALLDPLAGVDLVLLDPILWDPSVRKVFHGADYDLRMFHRDYGLRVRGLFDTMVASQLLGERSAGLAALLQGYLGVHLDKSHQRADWSRRPLPPEMVTYAMADTRHLLELASLLDAKLAVLGRTEWAEEEFRRIEAVRWTIEETDPESYRKVKGSARLDRRGLGVLRELHRWRDGKAREKNVPPFRVLRDEVLLGLVGQRPADGPSLAAVPGLPRSLIEGRGQPELLAAIDRGLRCIEAELPEVRARIRQRPESGFEARLHVLRRRRDELAAQLGIEGSVLASRRALEGILRSQDRGEGLESIPDLRAWQARVLGV